MKTMSFFVPMGMLRLFGSFFEIVFLGKAEVGVCLQDIEGPERGFNFKKEVFSIHHFFGQNRSKCLPPEWAKF